MSTRSSWPRRFGALVLGIGWSIHAASLLGQDLDSTRLDWDRTHWLAAGPGETPSGASGSADAGQALRVPTPALGIKWSASPVSLGGYIQAEVARTYADPEHWSKMRLRGELSAHGRINEHVKWKLSGRLEYDAVYDFFGFYPPDVRKDQRLTLLARENFLDLSAGNWDVRLGRQHVVWGEIVGLFFADVVSAKDMREFLLPEFDVLRIPQWAVRAEYAGERFHGEVLWVPIPSYDEFGNPGAEFFPPLPPVPSTFSTAFRGEARPARTLSNSNYGLRVSTLRNGWDLSGFFYRSMDTAPTFYRQILPGPQPIAAFEARHDRIDQLGSTVAKDLGPFVLKGEAIYTRGRNFSTLRVTDIDGVVPQNTLDWVAGADFMLPSDTRLNVQLFQRIFFNHDEDILLKRRESGYTVLLAHEFSSKTEAQVLWISSLERTDWLLRPRITWKFERNWRLAAGLDIFHGHPLGFFGRFSNRDRAYTELRYSF